MKKKSIGQFLSESREASLVIVLAVLLIVVGIINPSFLSFTNIRQIFLNNTLTFIMALGMLCVMLTAGIDISITSTLAFAGMSIGLLQ
ncbi:MAG: ABC transporter permease, partial [Lachnospiraceae bacterium]|nr:ABC transporter permease [Lachnospiraceae bacterium]